MSIIEKAAEKLEKTDKKMDAHLSGNELAATFTSNFASSDQIDSVANGNRPSVAKTLARLVLILLSCVIWEE